jgi:hypothetical protein
MKFFRRDERGAVTSALVVTLLSIVLGGGAAAAAVAAIVSSQGPADSHAIQTGPKDLVDPDTVIAYGG